MTATIPQPAAALTINDTVLERADQLTLSDLLESDLIADVVVRSICIIRKVLLSSSITDPEDQKLEAKLSAVYHAIGVENRNAAFDRQTAGAAAEPVVRPVPQVLPTPKPTAPKLDHKTARAHAEQNLKIFCADGVRTVTQDDLRREVEASFLQGGKQWHSTDQIELPSGETLWHKTLQTAMQQLAEDEVVLWSRRRNCWVILDV